MPSSTFVRPPSTLINNLGDDFANYLKNNQPKVVPQIVSKEQNFSVLKSTDYNQVVSTKQSQIVPNFNKVIYLFLSPRQNKVETEVRGYKLHLNQSLYVIT